MNIIAHNLFALNTQRQLGINTKSKSKSTEKLSSGYKINKAADDAAGLSISEKMRKQIRGLTQGIENTQDGISLCQVADGALTEVDEMLHRITELSIKSANGTNAESDRQAIQKEINEILQEIDRIGDTTTFNEKKLFNGSTSQINNSTIGNLNVNGKPLDSIPTTYTILADKNGFSINGDDFSWSHFSSNGATLADENILQGVYSFNYHGLSLSVAASNGATKDDMIGKLNGASFQTEYTNERDLKDSFEFLDFCGLIGVNNELTDKSDVRLKADDSGLWMEIDGSMYGGKISWKFGSALNEQGSDHWENPSYIYGDIDYKVWSIIDFCEKLPDPNCRPTAYLRLYEYMDKKDFIDVLNDSKVLIDVSHNVPAGGTISTTHILHPTITAENTPYNYRFTGLELNSHMVSEESIKVNQSNYTGQTIDKFDSLSLWIQSGCDAGDGMFLEIDNMNTSVLGINDLDVSTVDGANKAIKVMDEALQKISANRSKIGAQQNRLEHTIANEENIVENTTATESAIRDADMAKEMVQFSKDSILEQAGQAMLAQANQSNQGVLNLLQG